MRLPFIKMILCASTAALTPAAQVRADNQTLDLSPIVIGAPQAFTTQILPSLAFPSATVPTLHSFARANYTPPAAANSQWLMIGGMTNGLHDLGNDGFDPAKHNKNIYVVDPVTQQVWSRPMTDPTSGLTTAQIESLATTNAQYSQKGSKLYITGGYGPTSATGKYHTFSELTSVDIPGLMNWVKTGTGSAVANLRQISDPIFKVTGGEMATSANGKTHLVFGQDYPDNYESRQDGEYTKQVRSFTIVDNAGGLSISGAVSHPQQDDFRRRDLNMVPTIKKVNGNLVENLQALSGVFTPSFGAWTAPVNIDQDGIATQPDPLAPGTFKQGMNGYRCGTVGLYSASQEKMHTLLFGGISFQFYNPATGQIADDGNLPFINDITDIITDAQGNMIQHLLPASFPSIIAPGTGTALLLGAEAEFFLKDGIATFGNVVIDL
ncbi:MAG: hypothetical protein H7144_13210, partial [Burkholderiales bacterium]|nr:hypothetical protein [Phycisphaerae bacterium]